MDDEALRRFCVAFFWWWYNQPGSNTLEGYDEWLETDKAKELLSKLTPPHSD